MVPAHKQISGVVVQFLGTMHAEAAWISWSLEFVSFNSILLFGFHPPILLEKLEDSWSANPSSARSRSSRRRSTSSMLGHGISKREESLSVRDGIRMQPANRRIQDFRLEPMRRQALMMKHLTRATRE